MMAFYLAVIDSRGIEKHEMRFFMVAVGLLRFPPRFGGWGINPAQLNRSIQFVTEVW